jgi:DNA-binding MarR family transcriptional regulator
MDRLKTSEEIIELFIRLANKYKALEKIPVDYGVGTDLYHSERHLIDQIGDHPEMNITELARYLGVTKGAISQTVKKLEDKGVVIRYKGAENEKEVFLEFSDIGRKVYKKHKEVNKESIIPLYEELKKYSDDKVYFMVEMFKWMDTFLDDSKTKMQEHSKGNHR